MENLVLQNRLANPSCLIYNLNKDEENKELGILRIWTLNKPIPGTVIESNNCVILKIPGMDNYFEFNTFEVLEIISTSNFKGLWPSLSQEEKELRNNNSFYTVRVKPVSAKIDHAIHIIEQSRKQQNK